jgi:hypothetical protein
LRQAIAILKAVGLPEPNPHRPAHADMASTPKPDAVATQQALVNLLAEMEEILKPPVLPAQLERAKSAAVFIARHTPHGRVANLAMQLMSALHESRGYEDVPGGYRMALARLRAAVLEHATAATAGLRDRNHPRGALGSGQGGPDLRTRVCPNCLTRS